MRTRCYSCVMCMVMILSLLTGCFGCNIPPDISEVQQRFQNNREAIQTIVEYMIDTGYEDIYVLDSSGAILVGPKEMKIDNEAVCAAIKQLLENGEYIDVDKEGNTIYFEQWRGIRDIGCGIAYSINGVDTPEVQFMTELAPLSEGGWFYYVADYNSWRNGKRITR